MGVLDKINFPSDLKKLNELELKNLCKELREFVIGVVSKTGGHLASNLGVVELTVALHYIFDLPKDKIIWDVGHQSYVHKILTGRKDRFHTLRQFGGISGFPKRAESEYDCFNTGHSGTSISAALGLATARDLKKEDFKVIAVVGDASLSNGLSLEAINNAGHLKKDLIVILNDNEMSISPNVGALSSYLNKVITGEFYNRTKEKVKNLVSKYNVLGVPVIRVMKVIEEGVKGLISPGILFEELGFRYIGPVDGHNINLLMETLKSIKKFKEPILLHILTKKGKGYDPAESDPTSFHGTPAFEIESGEVNSKKIKTYTDAFSEEIIRIAKKNKKIIAITAAMSTGTGLDKFRASFPDRFFDVGIAEEHAVTFAAGLAISGFKPVVAIYSTFLQRAYDEIIHDVCLQNLPVIFIIDRAGIVGEDGETHQGTFDLSYLRHMPNMIIMSPADESEFKNMLKFAVKLNSPVAIRYPRCKIVVKRISGKSSLSLGKSAFVKDGKKICILVVGSLLNEVLEGAEELEKEGINIGIINVRFIKPLDEKLLRNLQLKFKKIIIMEENVIAGGYGSSVLEFVNKEGLDLDIKIIGFPDKFIENGNRNLLLDKYGLSKRNIIKIVKEATEGSPRGTTKKI
ncbi:MAG: 1-deoxy-D-xylulose-5-phosphate synthase [Candidatus Firestonebacteria bacterium]